MIQIRFHGRGGHGIKTASRILGTAAFLEGFEAQDSPLYGAERRGAPIVAFTRISDEPILMRGMISDPDIVIVADETLLSTGPGSPIEGVSTKSLVYVNTPATPEDILERYEIPGMVATSDVTGLVTDTFGSSKALSGAIGSISCRLIEKISEDHMREAVIEELTALGLTEDAVSKNVELAETCYRSVPPAVRSKIRTPVNSGGSRQPITLHSHPATISAPNIYAHGNTPLRHTGNWRVSRPVIDMSKCTKCGICVLRCPDGAIALDEEGYPLIDYEQCKGCLICTTECPLHLIEAGKESRLS